MLGGLPQLGQESFVGLPGGESVERARIGLDVHRRLNGGGVPLELIEKQMDQAGARSGGVGVLQQEVPAGRFGHRTDLLQSAAQKEDERKGRIE